MSQVIPFLKIFSQLLETRLLQWGPQQWTSMGQMWTRYCNFQILTTFQKNEEKNSRQSTPYNYVVCVCVCVCVMIEI